MWGNVWCTHLLCPSREADQKLSLATDASWFTVVYVLFQELESSAHFKTYSWNNMFTWREECAWVCLSSCDDTMCCACRNVQVEKKSSFSVLNLNSVRNGRCTCAQLPFLFLVSSVLKAICFLPSPSVMLSRLELPLCCLLSACNTCLSHKLCGEITWLYDCVRACMGSADDYWSVLDNNCISV